MRWMTSSCKISSAALLYRKTCKLKIINTSAAPIAQTDWTLFEVERSGNHSKSGLVTPSCLCSELCYVENPPDWLLHRSLESTVTLHLSMRFLPSIRAILLAIASRITLINVLNLIVCMLYTTASVSLPTFNNVDITRVNYNPSQLNETGGIDQIRVS